MSIRLYMQSAEDVWRWVRSAHKLPSEWGVKYYGDLDYTGDGRPLKMADRHGYEQYLMQCENEIDLYSTLVWLSCDLSPPCGPVQSVYLRRGDHDIERWSKVVIRAASLIRFFSSKGLRYASASRPDEYGRRNLFKYDVWGNGKASSSPVGRDLNRYIPGIYWLTYFSYDLITERNISTEELVSLGARATQVDGCGMLIQFGDSPDDWEQYDDIISQYLRTDDRFFSVERIVAPPNMSPREYMEYIRAGLDVWR